MIVQRVVAWFRERRTPADVVRRIFDIHDDGESWLYSAVSYLDAIDQHCELNCVAAGLPSPDGRLFSIGKIPDADLVSVLDEDVGEIVTKTAAEWAASEDGLIGTTCN